MRGPPASDHAQSALERRRSAASSEPSCGEGNPRTPLRWNSSARPPAAGHAAVHACADKGDQIHSWCRPARRRGARRCGERGRKIDGAADAIGERGEADNGEEFDDEAA